MAGGRFSVEAVFKAIDRVTAPVSRMQNRIGKFSRRAKAGFQGLNRSVDKVSAGIKKIATAATVATTIFVATMGPALAAGADFEQAIVNVGAVSLKTRDQIQPLEQLAIRLGKTTKFTATEAANAMEVLARAGFSTQDILSATPAVLSAAAASGLEIAEVADHVSNALKGMGLQTDQAGRVADVLALASARTNSSIGSLGESLSNVSSTARELRIPLEQTVASVALLQDVGLDASVAGSAFNTMLTKMAAPTSGMIKKMRRFGISFKDAQGNMLPLNDVLEQLSIAGKKAGGNFDKVAFLAELVGLRGQKAASNLATLFETGRVKELTKELENARGSAEKMANLRMNTVRGSLTLLGSAIDGVKVKLFGMNSGPLKNTIDRMTAWVGKNEDLIASKIGGFLSMVINNLDKIGTALKWIGTGLAVFYTLAAAVKVATVAMTAFNFVMSMNPISLIIIAIAGLVTAIIWCMNNWDMLKEKALGVADGILSVWGKVKDWFSEFFDWIVRKFKVWADIHKKILTGDFSGAMDATKSFFGMGESDEPGGPAAAIAAPAVISPQERTARSIEERNLVTRSELVIRDDTGRAEVPGGELGPGLELLATGGF